MHVLSDSVVTHWITRKDLYSALPFIHTNLERSNLFWTLLQKPPSTSHLMVVLVNLNDSCLGKCTLGITVLADWKVLETFSVEVWRRWIFWKAHEHRKQSQEVGGSIKWLPLRTELGAITERVACPTSGHILFGETRPGVSGRKWDREVDMRCSQLAGSEQKGKPPFPRYTLQWEKWEGFVENFVEKLKGAWC